MKQKLNDMHLLHWAICAASTVVIAVANIYINVTTEPMLVVQILITITQL